MNEFLKGLIENADKLGALSVASVWGFFTLILIAYLAWILKTSKEAEMKTYEARIEDAKTDGMVAVAIEKLSDQIKELRFKIKCLGGKDD